MASISSSLPNKSSNQSNPSNMLNRRFNQEVYYTPAEVDSVVGYFEKRGFDQTAAINTAALILEQAGKDKIPAFELIDTLKGVTDVELSNVVAQILNLNRSSCSTVGFRISSVELVEKRNILI